MPPFACFACGRTLWVTLPVAQVFAEERRCPRCGASLQDDRRVADRRLLAGRQRGVGIPPTAAERRAFDRRTVQRRRSAG